MNLTAPTWYIRKVAGTHHDLTPLGFEVLEFDGLDTPAVQMQSDTVPQAHGRLDHGFTYAARRFNLKIKFECATAGAYYEKRKLLQQIFKPGAFEDFLGVILPNGDHREIRFRTNGNMLDGGRFTGAKRRGQVAAIPCISADPLWFDPNRVEISNTGGPVAANTDYFFTIEYAGDVADRPRLTLAGNVDGLILENLTTGDILDFTGLTTLPTSNFVIDLRPQYYTIRDGFNNRHDGALSAASTPGTFRIAPANEVLQIGLDAAPISVIDAAGTNNFRIRNGTQFGFRLCYFNRYVGI